MSVGVLGFSAVLLPIWPIFSLGAGEVGVFSRGGWVGIDGVGGARGGMACG